MAAQIFNTIGKLGVGVAIAGSVVNTALYNVDGGHRAVMFDKFTGVKADVVGEGTHFMIPWVQKPIIYDIRARPKNIPTITGSKDLQNVNITLRILFRPRPSNLPNIYTTLGIDYDDRVLPSITNEVLKAVVAEFDAGELITQREMVSNRVTTDLTTRAEQFGLILDDISITHLTFGREFTAAVEMKQVAQQEAEKASETGGDNLSSYEYPGGGGHPRQRVLPNPSLLPGGPSDLRPVLRRWGPAAQSVLTLHGGALGLRQGKTA